MALDEDMFGSVACFLVSPPEGGDLEVVFSLS